MRRREETTRQIPPGKAAGGEATRVEPVLIGLTGEHAGHVFPLPSDDPFTLGASRDCDVVCLLDTAVSRNHCLLSRGEDGTFHLHDSASRNGTFVNSQRVTEPTPLRRGDRVQIGETTTFRFERLSLEEQANWVAGSVDALTGLRNRAFLDARLGEVAHETAVSGRPLSILMLDVDHFKDFNTRYGYAGGDRVLRGLADLVREWLIDMERPHFACRYGGEEFTLLLPGTDRATCIRLASELCQRVQATPFNWEDCTLNVTVSVGTATAEPPAQVEGRALLDAAAARLQAAKAAGRNRACH